MSHRIGIIGLALASTCAAVAPARGGIVYTNQTRSVSATTSFDGQTQTITAPDFGPFVQTADLAVTFPTAGGGTATNRAKAAIDCIVDPNGVKATGSITAAGGVGANAALQRGTGGVVINVDFTLDVDTPFHLLASERLGNNPGDVYKLKLRDKNNNVIVSIGQNDPATHVDIAGLLAAGDYKFEFATGLEIEDTEVSRNYFLDFQVPTPGGASMLALAGLLGLRRRR